MAFITCSFYSKVLQKSTQFNAIIPQDFDENSSVLYLLHGLKDDYTAWTRYTSVERYAEEAGIAVIMPDGGRGFYSDMLYGYKYYSFFVEEFFPYVEKLFALERKRDKTFIAGVSMGGYGALKFALLNPEKFGGAASLSGAVDVCSRLAKDPRWDEIKHLVFGDPANLQLTNNNLFYIAENYKTNFFPRLYIACGKEDFLYQNNVDFINALAKQNIPYEFHVPAGVHDWSFWDNQIQKAILFFKNTI